MIDILRAEGPHPDRHGELMLFGQLVGSWDVQIRFYDPDGGTTYDQRGEWRFDWVLDGRAVQDVLVAPNYRTGETLPGRRGIGTTLRYLPPESSAWLIFWVGATTGIILRLVGRRVGDEIQVEGLDVDGSQLRWTFSDIAQDRFYWRGVTSADGGATWRLEQEMLATRRKG